jgi:16S rRNA (uracil1498-N3)-methyltransferase
MRRFFIPAARINHGQALMSGSEFHHLRRVLRLKEGDAVTLTDEHGGEYQGLIARLSPAEALITITATTASPSSPFMLTLAQGLLKGQKMDLVIEKATELGVQWIRPFHSAFTVATLPNERQSARVDRWARIAQSAAKQSGSLLPSLAPPQTLAELLSTLPPGTAKLLCYEHETDLTLKAFAQAHPQLASLCIIVGPEGGFSRDEVDAARSSGAQVVSLGASTLRAETAGIVAVALCQFLWGA